MPLKGCPVTLRELEGPDPAVMLPLVRSLVNKRYQHTVPPADVDDLVQVGMEASCKAAKTWKPGSLRFTTYAYKRANWAIVDHLRHVGFGGRYHFKDYVVHSLDVPLGDDERTLLDLYAEAEAGEDDIHDPILADGIRDALSTVPPRARQAWHLTFDAGLKLAEAGKVMGITESGVSRLVTQARQAISAHPCMDGIAA